MSYRVGLQKDHLVQIRCKQGTPNKAPVPQQGVSTNICLQVMLEMQDLVIGRCSTLIVIPARAAEGVEGTMLAPAK